MSKADFASAIVLLVLFAVVLVACCYELAELTLRNTGRIVTIGVEAYEDKDCTTPLYSIEWGTLYPGGAEDIVIYLFNNGTCNLTLSMHTENWTPSNASFFLTLSWNYTDQTIPRQTVQAVMLTLTVASNVTDVEQFSFDIVITGSEQK